MRVLQLYSEGMAASSYLTQNIACKLTFYRHGLETSMF
jgi:uncharacterized membrane protein YeiB